MWNFVFIIERGKTMQLEGYVAGLKAVKAGQNCAEHAT
jgi:hypothetical protein